MKKLKVLALIFVILNVSTVVLGGNTSPYGRRTRRTLVERWAQNIIDYFEIDKLLVANSMANSGVVVKKNATTSAETRQSGGRVEGKEAKECNDPEEIADYFFNVYGEKKRSSEGRIIPEDKLDEMIKYQVLMFPKSRETQYKTDLNVCPRKMCFKYRTIMDMIKEEQEWREGEEDHDGGVDMDTFLRICPVLLYNSELNGCEFPEDSAKLEEWQKWVFGMLISGVVTVWSWGGAIIFPIIHKKIYKRMLTFMVSLAFGCLTCNSLLKYIPLTDGFDSPNIENTNRSYFLKHLVILAVLFFFFNFERFMKIYAIYRTQKFKEKRRMLENERRESSFPADKKPSYVMQMSGSSGDTPHFSLGGGDDTDDQDPRNINRSASRSAKMDKMRNKDGRKAKMKKRMSMDLGDVNIVGIQQLDQVTDKFVDVMKDDDDDDGELKISKSGRICCTSLTEGISNVRPIGWMAIFGDGLGNFIDGLSIGASISQNIALGLTTGLATWCGNIPQELGDFALLVRSGMTPFQALFYNYLSANSVYIGCTIGIVFGNDLNSARWIFAISGATSLYLGLAVLLPEMKSEFDENKDPIPEKLKITYVQLLGMLTGIILITILNMYEDDFGI